MGYGRWPPGLPNRLLCPTALGIAQEPGTHPGIGTENGAISLKYGPMSEVR
jgi:hypothetical protein